MSETPLEYNLKHTTWRPHQLDVTKWLLENGSDASKIKLLEAPTGCHRIGQGIMMSNGTVKKVEDIVVGDTLMGWDSTPRTVLQLCRGTGQMYEIIPIKGKSFVVNEDHVLTLARTNISKHKYDTRRKDCIDGKIVDVSVKDWLMWSKTQKWIHKLFRVPITEFDYQSTDLPISPYFLGVYLGDGYSSNGTMGICTADPEVTEEVYSQADSWGLGVRVEKQENNKSSSYELTYKRGQQSGLSAAIESLGLRHCRSDTKFIPHEYKTSSTSNRLELLAGILDTDGYLSRSVCYDYISKSKQLAGDVAFMARSLGFSAPIAECEKYSQTGGGGVYHRVCISGSTQMIPCRIERKQCQVDRLQVKNQLRTGFTVNKLGVEPYYGFTLDGDGRYLLDDFTVTHNSGKTAYATATSSRFPVIALMRTKNLQSEGYGRGYNFDVLFGRSNYKCEHDDAPPFATAADCLFKDEMHKCPYARSCKYLEVKERTKASKRAALNYSYWLASRWPRERDEGYVFLDECHQLSDQVLEYTGTTLKEFEQLEYDLPVFPELYVGDRGLFDDTPDPTEEAIDYLSKCIATLEHWLFRADKQGRGNTSEGLKKMRDCEQLIHKLEATTTAMIASPRDWFIKSGRHARMFNGEARPGFVAKPLTARYHFPKLFLSNKRTTVLMSATVGNPEAFTKELGIIDYQFTAVPNQWDASVRPVYILDAPAMGKSRAIKDPLIYEKQADVIAKAILGVDHSWSGVIHTTKIAEAKLLAERLSKRGLSDRVWLPTIGSGTDKQAIDWIERKRKIPNSLAIAWTWHEGVNLVDESICIISKINFADLGDEFEKARMAYDNKFYLQRAAWAVEQSAGRTRRGEASDYDVNGKQVQLVAIADGNVNRVEKYFSQSLREALVKR